MGGRANCVVKQESSWDEVSLPEIFLYTRWNGSELPDTVQRALRKAWRWEDDASYLTRIIFDTMSEGDQGSETGFGISTSPPDNDYPYIVVDSKNQEVRFEEPDSREVLARHDFREYCGLERPRYPGEEDENEEEDSAA